jgi:uncharacterized membrane-anchored protein YitT (DUF2179 family)
MPVFTYCFAFDVSISVSALYHIGFANLQVQLFSCLFTGKTIAVLLPKLSRLPGTSSHRLEHRNVRVALMKKLLH